MANPRNDLRRRRHRVSALLALMSRISDWFDRRPKLTVFFACAVLPAVFLVAAGLQERHSRVVSDRAQIHELQQQAVANCHRAEALLDFFAESQRILKLAGSPVVELWRPAFEALVHDFNAQGDCPEVTVWVGR